MSRPESELLTLQDWRRAYLGGATAAALVPARASAVFASSPATAWILRVEESEIGRRCEALDADASRFPAREALLKALPLFGVPFVVKDNIDVEGLPTTAACPAAAVSASRSATVVRRLLDAGAVLIGKTNLDQFATGLVGTRSPFGAPSSVFAAERVSGGSSAGSAVLVGRGDVPFSLGTDTAGSGRVPAGFNHIVGLKPTLGRVGTAGVLPACRSLDCVSVFALTVEDAAAVLAVIEGDDPDDDYSAFRRGPARWGDRPRVGVPRRVDVDAGVGYDAGWREACAALEAMGAVAVPVDMTPLLEIASLLYDGPWVAERYAVVQSLLESAPEAVDPTVAAVIGRARGMSAVDAFRAQYALQHGRRAAQGLWDTMDLLMVPTAPHHPSFAEVAANPVGTNARLGTYTNFVNLLGWSALALPAGVTPGGLPFGVTFIAPGGADAALVHWGRRWQATRAQPLGATGRPSATARDVAALPLPWPATEPTLPVAVVGAHLSGLPLNHQLTDLGATLLEATHTAPLYRLFALPGTTPRKPGLLRVSDGGAAIAVEVWSMPLDRVGTFLAQIPSPLGLGTLSLHDGRAVHGFLCEPAALAEADDVTRFGGWRAYLASL